MEEKKRKEIETQLRWLIESAAAQNPKKNTDSGPRLPGNVRVIRRRKGRPDRHIFE